MKRTIWWSIQNGGDGSAHPLFFVSEKLAEYDQNNMNENGDGWGENCTGSIQIESDSEIKITNPEVYSAFGYLVRMWEHWWSASDAKKFMKKFFPKGLPEFTISEDPVANGYKSIYFEADGEIKYRAFIPDKPLDQVREHFVAFTKGKGKDKGTL